MTSRDDGPAALEYRGTFSSRRIGTVETAPAQMTLAERVFLYALVVALRPERVIEIGTRDGGSALIIAAALDDLGEGTLACVDPDATIAPENFEKLRHRCTLFAAKSPEALPEAARSLGGPINLALIDGDHAGEAVHRDIEGLLPWLAKDAYVLLHDAHHSEFRQALSRSLGAHPDLVDCGLISRARMPGGDQWWGGFYLLRQG